MLADEPFSHLDEEARRSVLLAFEHRILEGSPVIIASPKPLREVGEVLNGHVPVRLLHMRGGVLEPEGD